MKKQLLKNSHRIDGKCFGQMSLDSGSGSGIEKIMDPNPVNIRPDPKPCI